MEIDGKRVDDSQRQKALEQMFPQEPLHTTREDFALDRVVQMNSMADFIASFCTDPAERDICRRAALNMYRLGQLHEAIESVYRNKP
jgi:hypothetical protein